MPNVPWDEVCIVDRRSIVHAVISTVNNADGNGISADRLDEHVAAHVTASPHIRWWPSAQNAVLLAGEPSATTAARRTVLELYAQGVLDEQAFSRAYDSLRRSAEHLPRLALDPASVEDTQWSQLGIPERRQVIHRLVAVSVGLSSRADRFDSSRIVIVDRKRSTPAASPAPLL